MNAFTAFLLVVAPVLALGLSYLGVATIPSNRTGWFLLLMGLAYVIGGPIYFWKRRAEPPASKEETGDRSFWLVQPGFAIAIFGAPLEYLYLPAVLPRDLVMQIAGLLLVGTSVVLHSWARQVMHGQFSGHLQIQSGHRLIQGGPYRYLRHPAYLGYLLMALGVAIGYSSLAACAAVLALLLPGLIYRIRVEERLLVDEFGDAYRAYAQRTRRLVPGLW